MRTLIRYLISEKMSSSGFGCPMCGKEFVKKSNLSDHIRRVHYGVKRVQTRKVSFQCELCRKELSSKRSYTEHLNTHWGSRPFACDECQYSANSEMNLRRHKQRKHVHPDQWNFCSFPNFLSSKYFLLFSVFKRIFFPIMGRGILKFWNAIVYLWIRFIWFRHPFISKRSDLKPKYDQAKDIMRYYFFGTGFIISHTKICRRWEIF